MNDELKKLRVKWLNRRSMNFHGEWGGPNQQEVVTEILTLVDAVERAEAQRDRLRAAASALVEYANDGGMFCTHIAPGTAVRCPLCLTRVALEESKP